MNIRTNFLGAALLASLSTPLHAVTVNFSCITDNDLSGDSCAIAQSQMSVELTDATVGTDNKALFTFNNTGTDLDAFISEVYFMDGTLLGISSIDNSSAGIVEFTEGATPANLPGYSPTASFSADNVRSSRNGVHAGEFVGITFDLLSGITFADTVDALDTGALVIGIHAKGLGVEDQYSESMINIAPVPVPAAVWLFGSGLVGLVGFARRQQKA